MIKSLTICLLVVLCTVSDALPFRTSKSRAIQNFHCNDILNTQIKTELQAAHTYLSLSNHFASDRVALEGFSKMFEKSWKEETEHAEKLIDYVIKRGGSVEVPNINKPGYDNKWSSMDACKIVEFVLNLEKSVHEELLKVHKCGGGENVKDNVEDPHLQDFIEENYLGEQVDANKELADLLTKLERTTKHMNMDGSSKYMCDGLGLHIIDKEIAAKFA